MGALTHDSAIFQHQNQVRRLDGADALGHNDHNGIPGLGVQGTAQGRVGLEVQRGEAVVKEVEVRLPEDGPGDGQTLPLSAGDVGAAGGHVGVKAEFLLLHEVQRLGHLQRVVGLRLGGVRLAPPEVVQNGPGEEESLLGHDADVLSQLLLPVVPDVAAVDQHGALRGVVVAGNQVQQRALARACAADDGQSLPRGNAEADVRQGVGTALAVAIGDVFEFQRPDGILQRPGLLRVGDGGLGVEHLHNPVRRRLDPGEDNQRRGEHHNTQNNHAQVLNEGLHVAVGGLMGRHKARAEPEHQEVGHAHEEAHHRLEGEHIAAHVQGGIPHLSAHAGKALLLALLLVEGADDPHSVEQLPRQTIHLIQQQLLAQKQLPHMAHHEKGEEQTGTHGEEHNPRQTRRGQQGDGNAAQTHQRRGEHGRQGLNHANLHLHDVISLTADERGRSELVKVPLGQAQDMGKKIPAQASGKAHGCLRDKFAVEQRKHHRKCGHDSHRGNGAAVGVIPSAEHTGIDDPLAEHRKHQGAERGQKAEHDNQHDLLPVAAQIFCIEFNHGSLLYRMRLTGRKG